MLRVRDHIDEIIEYCFDDQLKAVLEATVSGRKLTVKSQFLYHYKHACYMGTLEELKDAVLYQIHNNYDRVLRMQDFYANMEKLMDVRGYQEVRLDVGHELTTQGKITNSVMDTEHEGQSVNKQSNTNLNVGNNYSTASTGASNTNELERLVDVIKPPQESYTQLQVEEYKLTKEGIQKETVDVQLQKLESSEENNPIYYQHFTKESSVDNSRDTTVGKSSVSNEDKSDSKTQRVGSTTRGQKMDKGLTQLKYVDNEARIRAWTVDLPRLKQRFWQIFHLLFRYEHL